MTTTTRTLGEGEGWMVHDIVCTAGPRDRAFEEEHRSDCVAVVSGGSFGYRTRQGRALMAPGALVLGNDGACFECGHEHGVGDRCLSFHFRGDLLDRIRAAVPGARQAGFRAARVAPGDATARLVAEVEAEAGSAHCDPEALHEIALRLAGAAITIDAGLERPAAPKAGEERRVAKAIRLIERHSAERIDLDRLAGEACLSPYHFLRVFRAVAGMTPYRYVLATRMRRAASRLRATDDPVSAVALDAGFEDLSTFNRRFRSVMGQTPGEWRRERSVNSLS